jgi:excisionase family DNA binding protein
MDLLTTGEAARLLDLSPDSVRRFEREGLLSAIRVGKGQRLFTKSEIERLSDQRKIDHRTEAERATSERPRK